MRVAYCLHWFPKLSETFIHDEIEWMREMGHEVFVLASRELKELPGLHFDGYRRVVNMRDSGLVAHLRKLGVQHIHTHFGRFFLHGGVLDLVTAARLPFTLTVHMSEIWGDRALSPPEWDLVWRHPACRAIVAITEIHKERLCRLGVPGAAIAVIPCSLDLRQFPYHSEELALPRVLSVGRIEPMKGHEVLLEAFGIVRGCVPGAELRIIGGAEGEYGRILLESAAGYAGVTFLGAQPRAVVRDELASASIFALPCIVTPASFPRAGRRDGLPIAILEAMASGVPVITSAVGGIPSAIVNNDTGVLCGAGEISEVANAIAGLLRDPMERVRIARNAREYVETHHDREVNLPILADTMQRRRGHIDAHVPPPS